MPDISQPTRILIIEDEEDVVQPVAFRLEMQGYEVLMEPDGELGFQTATTELPDLILLDVMLPGIDGLTLCGILKERKDTRMIPIIVLTARTTMGDVEKAFSAQADDFMAKPFEWSELMGKINRCLAGKQPLASSAR